MNNEFDILLVNAPSPNPIIFLEAFKSQGMPSLGLCYLATILKQENYSVKIIDMLFPNITMNTVMQYILNYKIKIIGISCSTETYLQAVRLANIVKKAYEDCIIVLGGPHVSFEYQSALSNDVIDYVVLNEGEISFKKLCNYYLRGVGQLKDINGIAYIKNNTVHLSDAQKYIPDLDVLPIPDRLIYDNFYNYPLAPTISTSRGCPGNCIFCAASALSGGKYRMRSVQSIIAEIEYLKSLGFNDIYFVDDTMTISIKRMHKLMDELISNDLRISWFCESRVDAVDKDILFKMKSAGLAIIQFGVESGDQGILDSIKKEITLQQIRNVFKWCQELGISTHTNMIIGQPSDNLKTIKNTVGMAKEIIKMGGIVSLSICTPFPGTPIWQNPKNYEIEIIDNDLENYNTFNPVFSSKFLTNTEIRNEYYNAVSEIKKISKIYNDETIKAKGTRISPT